MRRISTGVQGRPILGNFFTETNTFSTRETNQDIVLEPNGAGVISAESHLRIDGDHALIFRDSDNNNTITIESPAISSDYTLTLPTGIGTAGDVLTVDGSGNLSFSGINVNINNQTADTATYYPLLSTSTSGDVGGLSVSSSKLSFQPSSGTLTITDISVTNGTFSNNVSISNDLTVTNDFTAGTITETSSFALKTNIEPIKNAVEKISALDGVNYVRISSGRRESGLIAEDVEKILPELVESSGKYKSISYSRLTAYLIEAVKDLQLQLDSLSNNGG